MTSISANPTTDSGALEKLLFKATNPSNKLEDVNTIKQFCDLINKDESDNSSIIAIRLLAHKIQSPQEMEAIQSLAVLEACVKSCGSRTPEHVKKKVIELLYLWSTSVMEETKISEAYQMLKTQGIVTNDPTHVKDAVFAPSLSPRIHEDPLNEDQSKQLKKLLQSRNSEDLQKANKIIRGMVQDDEKRIEALSKRTSELTLVTNNAKLLNEMLDHYNASSVPTDELELLKELSSSCEKMQLKIHKLASESDDNGIGEVLQASDEISRVLERYKTIVVEGKTVPKQEPKESKQLLDVNNDSEMSLIDEDILNLLSTPVSTTPPTPTSVLDLLTNGSPIKINDPPLSTSFLSLSTVGESNGLNNVDECGSIAKGLLELDALGEEAMKALLPSVKPEFTKKKKKAQSLLPPVTLTNNHDQPMTISQDLSKKEEPILPGFVDVPKLSDINVKLSDIQPGEFPPCILTTSDHDIGIDLHFGKDELHPGVISTVLTFTNKLSSPVSDIELKPVVPKGVKVRLQEPSGKDLPAFNPFIPPPACTQVMLLQKAQKSDKISSFKYVVSYKVDNETQTEMGFKIKKREACLLQRISFFPEKKTSPENKLRSMRRLIELSGISHKELKRLKVIHISGTKGKGSTCAMIESIIRKSYSLKTGFYSSPHLISATERIRISGRPISQEKFSDYFWPLYNKLKDSKEDIFFFKILTVMALNVFIKEKVDIAIIEVGIGGTYDCTNIIDNPVACGITALGLDHTSLLGNTIQEIAWHKAGICKPNVPVFVNAYQAPEAMSVIKKIAKERGAPLYVAPEFSTYDWNSHSPLLGIDGHIQLQNAGLALQIAKYVLSLHEPQNFSPGKPFKLSCSDKEGLASCSWPGRFHRIQRNDQITLYLDAAHTKESIEACVDWYLKRNSRKKKHQTHPSIQCYS
ncbi:FPGS [Lepeophtheirus salmonis]|uniref:FPGS n=1 Tax=Lepeophtheirus salmonis TaxID=72036 RepID=A0A7R8H2B2_LEPSM|nr:FPGS [Lepeophtheirus salmonis]CAF2810844.1 FPGS [Lepeophtheirus salmonis]